MLPGEKLNAIIAKLNAPDNKLNTNEVCLFLSEAIENESAILDLSRKTIPFNERMKRMQRISQANLLLSLIHSLP